MADEAVAATHVVLEGPLREQRPLTSFMSMALPIMISFVHTKALPVSSLGMRVLSQTLHHRFGRV